MLDAKEGRSTGGREGIKECAGPVSVRGMLGDVVQPGPDDVWEQGISSRMSVTSPRP